MTAIRGKTGVTARKGRVGIGGKWDWAAHTHITHTHFPTDIRTISLFPPTDTNDDSHNRHFPMVILSKCSDHLPQSWVGGNASDSDDSDQGEDWSHDEEGEGGDGETSEQVCVVNLCNEWQ